VRGTGLVTINMCKPASPGASAAPPLPSTVPTAQGSTARGFTRVEFRLADAPELSLSGPSEGG